MTDPPQKKPDPRASSQTDARSGADPASNKQTADVVLVHGVTEDRQGLKVIRARESGIEVGEVRPLKEGQPLNQDVVKLTPRPEAPYLCDVKTEFSAEEAAAARTNRGEFATRDEANKKPQPSQKGPAQVATNTYRDNWDVIWARTRVTSPGSNDLN